VKRKHRLLWRYTLLGVVLVGASLWVSLAVLGRDRTVPDSGLVPGLTNQRVRGLPGDAPKLRFTAVPLETGADAFVQFVGTRTRKLPEDMGCGVAVEDFDGDGYLDLFFVNAGPLGGELPECALFRNRGGFTFERVKTPLPRLIGMGVAAADYDGDGDFDLYVTGYGRNVLLRNDGDFVFHDVTAEAGVAGGGFSSGACWGDVDNDGDLDLYVCRYVKYDETMEVRTSKRGHHSLPATLNPSTFPAESNLLYLQDNGRFVEVAEKYGAANAKGKSLSAVFADLDGDGLLDLYIANDVSDNQMLRGRRSPPFEDVTYASCTADWRGAMGVATADADGDGDLDLFLTHWKPEENVLYIKENEGLFFRDDAERSMLGPPSRGLIGWSTGFADFDSDGRPDLFVINGSTFEEESDPRRLVAERPAVFWNGGRIFFDLSPTAGPAFQEPIVGRGGAAGDLDNDGDLDLVIVRRAQTPLLLRNDTVTKNRDLTVDVRGSFPNLFAYGALVTVESGGRKQVQQVGTKVGYLSSGPQLLHFGLGQARVAERVTVRFLSGKTATRTSVPAGNIIVLKEVDPRTLGGKMDKARDSGPEQARATYREVLQLDPFHPGALYNLALLSEPQDALDLCRRLLTAERGIARARLLRVKLWSDPARPENMRLDAALEEVLRARELNREETGTAIGEGRILLLKREWRAAAERFEKVRANPRGAAYSALAWLRAGEPERAKKLLAYRSKAAPKGVSEEGDTGERSMGDRDALALLLELGDSDLWQIEPASEDTSYPRAVFAEPSAMRAFDFRAAARWALDDKAVLTGPVPGATVSVEADVDGDGKPDRIVGCGTHDLTAPMPWWVLLKTDDGYRRIRGPIPRPGFGIAGLAAADLDGDGRAEVILTLDDDDGTRFVARYRPAK